jgi:hypothetical protein
MFRIGDGARRTRELPKRGGEPAGNPKNASPADSRRIGFSGTGSLQYPSHHYGVDRKLGEEGLLVHPLVLRV